MRQLSATYLAAKYVNELWADVAHRAVIRTPRTQCTITEAITAPIEAQQHITQLYSLHRRALVYMHRCKSKRATDFDVNKNNSHGEHFFF